MFIREKIKKNDKFTYLSKINDKTDKSATKAEMIFGHGPGG